MATIEVNAYDQTMNIDEAKKLVIKHKDQLFKYYDEGNSRFVYVNAKRTKVIKIEKNRYGNHNQKEYDIYYNAPLSDRAFMAKPDLIVHGNSTMIEQDFCEPIKFIPSKPLNPQQCMFALSCRNEVGWTKYGQLVCFDLDEFNKY